MKKYIRRFIPTHFMDFSTLESWLSDLAEEGLFLVSFGMHFAKFERKEPQKTAYRIEPLPAEEHGYYIRNIQNAFASAKDGKQPLPVEEKNNRMVELYAEFDWEKVCSITPQFCIFRTAEEHPTELHTDPIAQSIAYERLYRRQKRGLLVLFPLLLALLFLCLYFDFCGGHFYYSVRFGFSLLVNVLLLLGLLFDAYRQLHALHTIKSRLQDGISMPHQGNWQKSRFRRKIGVLLFLAPLIYIYLNIYYMISTGWSAQLRTIDHPLPYLSLAEIETAPSFTMKEAALYPQNTVRFDTSLLAPLQYSIQQKGIVPDERWADGSGIYSPSLSVDYCQLRFQGLAKPFLESILKNRLYPEGGTLIPLQGDGFDEAYLYQNGSTKLFLRNGNVVLEMDYYGKEELLTHLAEITALTEQTYSPKKP